MNYQPLFNLMSDHGLTLLEGEMDEIIECVNDIQVKGENQLKCENDALYLKVDQLEQELAAK